MRERATVLGILVTAATLAVGCSKAPASPSTAEPDAGGDAAEVSNEGDAAAASSAGDEAAASSEVPEGAKVVCHLDCSGNQAKGYGATEEDARADARTHVAEICKPEDGQFFIFCEAVP